MNDLTPEQIHMLKVELDLQSEHGVTFVANGVLHSVHPESACSGRHCWVHRPSQHPLAHAPVYWDSDSGRAFRVCDHDQLHPDPDDAHYRIRALGDWPVAAFRHECDGCCGHFAR
ncbi:hypothetical protein [Aeromicrobium sp. A1-2]|uniref:hypothetical protein n=1 Tax=Aeromicrobium sp. A1-2 TaxID=2107713 RepID=UPI0013C2B15F|nr:hypothetical protein [Aeromicrobium sp. A1-2]